MVMGVGTNRGVAEFGHVATVAGKTVDWQIDQRRLLRTGKVDLHRFFPEMLDDQRRCFRWAR